MNTNKDIGSVLKTSLEGFSSMPDDIVWSGIEKGLIRRKRMRYVILLLILLGIGTIISSLWIISSKDKDNASEDLEKEVVSPLPKKQLDSAATIDQDSVSIQERDPKEIIKHRTEKQVDSGKKKKRKEKYDLNDNLNYREQVLALNLQIVDIDFSSESEMNLNIDLEDTIDDQEEKKIEKLTWGIFPFTSLDHYNAFGRNTSNQFTHNYGVYLSYYSSDRLTIRSGYKEFNLSYTFEEQSIKREQQVNYTEIPLEARYFISQKQLKTSFIVGGSYTILRNASITNLTSDSTRENRDLFRRQLFSFNAGLGLHYDFHKNWRINLESVFQYQNFALRRNADYAPYVISTSIGIEYQFKL